MAVSKRLRYEILRRDNHTCRYCGGSAPEVTLTVDHVVPVALGGGDDASNLVAACRDCNAGKTSSSPDAPIVDQVADDAIRWANAMRQAADEYAANDSARQAIHDSIADAWGPRWMPSDWADSVDQFIRAGLTQESMLQLVDVALRARYIDNRWSYFCGCCWRRINDIQGRAAEIAGTDMSEGTPSSEDDHWMDDLNSWVNYCFEYRAATLPDDDTARAQVVRERFHLCPIHVAYDCVGDRCRVAALVAGCTWIEEQQVNDQRLAELRREWKSSRRQAIRTAYRAGYEDAAHKAVNDG